MVATGPRPGSTPIKVPSTAPPKAYSRLVSVKATPRPSARLFKRSMCGSSTGDELRPQGDDQAQPLNEDEPGAQRQDHHVEQRILPVELVARQRGHDDQQIGRASC